MTVKMKPLHDTEWRGYWLQDQHDDRFDLWPRRAPNQPTYSQEERKAIQQAGRRSIVRRFNLNSVFNQF